MGSELSPAIPADAQLPPAVRRRSLVAAIGCTSVVGMVMGLTWPLLALVLERQGVDGRMIGLNAATQSLAIFAVSPLAPRILGRLGMVRTLALCLAAAASALFLLPLLPGLGAWFPIRFLLGASVAVLFIAGETWVVRLAPAASRGRIVGLFGLVWGGAFAVGPLIIGLTGSEGWPPFLAAMAIVAAAALPLAFAVEAPPPRAPASPSLVRTLRRAPVPLLALALLGVLDSVHDSFLPLYGLRHGLGETSAVALLTVLVVGVTAWQIPAGWLADRFDRGRLLRLSVGAALLFTALLPAVMGSSWLAWPVVFLLGCAVGGIWMLSLVLVGDRFPAGEFAAANAVRGVLLGLGAIGGPTAAGLALESLGPHGIPAVTAAALLLYLAVACAFDRAPLRPGGAQRPSAPG